MKEKIRKQLVKVKDMLEEENRSLGEDFPYTSTKDLREFKINQRLIESIEKALKDKEEKC